MPDNSNDGDNSEVRAQLLAKVKELKDRLAAVENSVGEVGAACDAVDRELPLAKEVAKRMQDLEAEFASKGLDAKKLIAMAKVLDPFFQSMNSVSLDS